MRITKWGEYGIHCCVYIAHQSQKDLKTTVSATEIGETQGIPVEYAQQILFKLKQNGILQSVRGAHGGYRLARPALELSLLDIIQGAEGDTFEIMCETKPLSAERCDNKTPCALRPFWYGLREHVNTFLAEHTLEDVLEKSQELEAPVQLGTH